MTENDKLRKVRKVDNNIGALLSDIADFIIKENYSHALQASAYLLIALSVKAGKKPFTALRSVYSSGK